MDRRGERRRGEQVAPGDHSLYGGRSAARCYGTGASGAAGINGKNLDTAWPGRDQQVQPWRTRSGRSFRWAASWAKWNRCSRAPTKLQSRGCNRWNRSAQHKLPPLPHHHQPPALQLLLPQGKAHARDSPQRKLLTARPRLRLRQKQRRLHCLAQLPMEKSPSTIS